MEELAETIKNGLEHHFAGSNAIEIEWQPSTNRISGLLLWEGFGPLTHRERQRIIFDFLRDELEAESKSVSLIFAYSPQEYELMQSAVSAM